MSKKELISVKAGEMAKVDIKGIKKLNIEAQEVLLYINLIPNEKLGESEAAIQEAGEKLPIQYSYDGIDENGEALIYIKGTNDLGNYPIIDLWLPLKGYDLCITVDGGGFMMEAKNCELGNCQVQLLNCGSVVGWNGTKIQFVGTCPAKTMNIFMESCKHELSYEMDKGNCKMLTTCNHFYTD